MIKKVNLSFTTCYLLPVGEKYLLVDTGYERDKKKFYKELKRHDISLEKIDYLLLTHYHDDHAGLVSEVVDKNPHCKIIMHKNAPDKLAKGKNDMSKCSYVTKAVSATVGLASKFSKGTYPPYEMREKDIIILDDISFEEIGIDIDGKIVYTPGHTDDSISIILKSGICICGDAAANMLPMLGTKHCVIVLEDLAQYYMTWEKLLNENISEVYPAHGKEFKAEELRQCMNGITEGSLV